MNYVRTITQKGQVTVPAAIRKALGLKPNDKVTFRVDAEGVRLEPAKGSLLAGYGAVKLRGGTKDIKRLRRETEAWVADQALKRGR
jgi:AbrB family looped-hinge helix DNA binding protein